MPAALASLFSVFLIYSLLALRDLLRHGADVERAATRGDLDAARFAVAKLVGRDTARMDGAACTRAAIESLSENLTDGFISPVFWYALGGLPGLIVFKVVSTMDSMVGYKTERYLRFGWCGARMDDWMNWIPARITWLLLSAVAVGAAGLLRAQVPGGGLAAARDRARAEFGLERSCHRGRTGAAADRPDLGRWAVGHRHVVGGARRSSGRSGARFSSCGHPRHGDRNSGRRYCNWNSGSVILN